MGIEGGVRGVNIAPSCREVGEKLLDGVETWRVRVGDVL